MTSKYNVMLDMNTNEAGKWMVSDRLYFVDLLVKKVLSEDGTFQ